MIREIDPQQAEELCKGMIIPPKPEILLAIERARQQDEPDFALIGSLISSDMTLAASVIKTVNSPLFRRNSRIASVSQALQLLGLNNVCNIVQALALTRCLSGNNASLIQAFWTSAQSIATISACLAESVRQVSCEDAYTFGLFHHCGKPLMATRFADYGATVLRGEYLSREEFIALEVSRHNTSHNVVGHLLARTWYLPDHVSLAILNHHNYSLFDTPGDKEWQRVCNLIALTSLAEHIHKRAVKGFEHQEWETLESKLLEHLDLDREEFLDKADQARDMIYEG